MRFPEFSPVRLTTDRFESEGVRLGAVGFVLEGKESGYVVEFSRPDGTTIALLFLEPGDIEPAPEVMASSDRSMIEPRGNSITGHDLKPPARPQLPGGKQEVSANAPQPSQTTQAAPGPKTGSQSESLAQSTQSPPVRAPQKLALPVVRKHRENSSVPHRVESNAQESCSA